jgi:hypothetical protein
VDAPSAVGLQCLLFVSPYLRTTGKTEVRLGRKKNVTASGRPDPELHGDSACDGAMEWMSEVGVRLVQRVLLE